MKVERRLRFYKSKGYLFLSEAKIMIFSKKKHQVNVFYIFYFVRKYICFRFAFVCLLLCVLLLIVTLLFVFTYMKGCLCLVDLCCFGCQWVLSDIFYNDKEWCTFRLFTYVRQLRTIGAAAQHHRSWWLAPLELMASTTGADG